MGFPPGIVSFRQLIRPDPGIPPVSDVAFVLFPRRFACGIAQLGDLHGARVIPPACRLFAAAACDIGQIALDHVRHSVTSVWGKRNDPCPGNTGVQALDAMEVSATKPFSSACS